MTAAPPLSAIRFIVRSAADQNAMAFPSGEKIGFDTLPCAISLPGSGRASNSEIDQRYSRALATYTICVPSGEIATTWSLPGAVFAPDGKWVAYASSEGRTRSALYVQPFPPTGAKYQISKNEEFGHHPVWSPDGKELFFAPGAGPRLHVVSIATQPAFSFGEAVAITRPFLNAGPWLERPFDISRGGQRFLGLIDAAQAALSGGPQAPQIRVVQNWQEELKRLVPTR